MNLPSCKVIEKLSDILYLFVYYELARKEISIICI